MPKQEREKRPQCDGGLSYNRNRGPHEKGMEVRCYRCDTVMGCRWCCESPRDLICLKCHNWATRGGVRMHGDVMPNFKVPHVRNDKGWQHYEPKQGLGIFEKKL